MVSLRINHPPAGATTLIVSLGILSMPRDLVIIEVAVVLLTAQAIMINRLAGVPYPIWKSKLSVIEHDLSRQRLRNTIDKKTIQPRR